VLLVPHPVVATGDSCHTELLKIKIYSYATLKKFVEQLKLGVWEVQKPHLPGSK